MCRSKRGGSAAGDGAARPLETSKRSSARRLALCAGAAAAACAFESPAPALDRLRDVLGVRVWEKAGIKGKGAVVGNLEGLPPLLSHRNLRKTNLVALAWEGDGRSRFAQAFPSAHPTATLGAMVSNGKSPTRDRLLGITPRAGALVGWFAQGLDSEGFFTGATTSSAAWALFAMTDQTIADELAAELGVAPWRVATVVNTSFGLSSPPARRGEDEFSRTFNAVACMTGATIVCAAGEAGADPPPPSGEEIEEIGNVLGPAAAYNVVSVGRLGRDLTDVFESSGRGPIQVFNHGFRLIDPNIPPDNEGPPPDPEIILAGSGDDYTGRPGVDIVAPGTLVQLPGSPFASPLDTLAASRTWSGTSFASALVTGGAALVHEYGARHGLSTHGLVTKAVLLNSANKERLGVESNAREDEDDPDRPLITTAPIDPVAGSGALDLGRLYRQYALGLRDYTRVFGFVKSSTPDPISGEFFYNVPAIGTDPGVPFVTTFERDLGGGIGPGGTGLTRAAAPPVSAAFGEDDGRVRPLQAGGNDPNVGGGRPDVPPAAGDGVTGSGAGGLPSGPFATGWDHGNLGQGFIDLPVGPLTAGTRFVATLVWHRTERWRSPDVARAGGAVGDRQTAPDTIGGRGKDRAPLRVEPDPAILDEFTLVHTVGVRGNCTCGDEHPEVIGPDGEPLHPTVAKREVERALRESSRRPKVEVGLRDPRDRGENTGLDIFYAVEGSVAAIPGFVDALNEAASYWEERIRDNVLVRFDVGLTSGQGFIAAAGSNFVTASYSDARTRLIDAAAPEEKELIEALPLAGLPYTNDGSGNASIVRTTSANARALGYSPGFPEDSSIVFNTDFTFDVDPSDGITPGQVDLVYVMIHELGHSLGFVSNTDFPVAPTFLDFYRFGINGAPNDPSTLAHFGIYSREGRVGFEAALDTVSAVEGLTGGPHRFSTGVQGDGRQASHWKDQSATGEPFTIGVMDPTYEGGAGLNLGYITQADLLAMSLIGWDINIFEPAARPSFPLRFDDSNTYEHQFQMELENLDLELWQRRLDGSGNRLVFASRSQWCTVEQIDWTAPQDTIPTECFLRVRYAGPKYDLGGSGESLSVPGFTNLPNAEVEYGLAWYADLSPIPGVDVSAFAPPAENGPRVGDLDRNGVVDLPDLLMLLGAMGTADPDADLNADGVVDAADLDILVRHFGYTRPAPRSRR